MHVLIIPSEEFVPKEMPTAGIFQHHQATILKQAGHKIGVISIRQSFSIAMLIRAGVYKMVSRKANNACDQYSLKELLILGYRKAFKPQYFLQKEYIDDVPVFRIDGFYYTPPADNKNHFGWIKAGMAGYKEYVRNYGKPDLIHAHNSIYAGMLAQKIKSKFQVPYIITEMSTAFARKIIDKKALGRVKEACNKSAIATAISEPFCSLLNDTFNFSRFECLPMVLDPNLERREYNAGAKKATEFIFLNIAELHPKKDHELLIKSFKKAYEVNQHMRLWIGGEGVLSAELKKLVETEHLGEVVRFLGLLTRQEVYQYIIQSDCFVLPSKFETFGLVVIEAMLFGKPVIVTKCGGPESFVTPDVGIVIEKESEEQLVQAMLNMTTNHLLYDTAAIRQYTLDHFGQDIFLQRVDTLYKKAIQAPL